MSGTKSMEIGEEGFSLPELVLVMMGILVLLAAAVPALNSTRNSYELVLAAQSIAAQLQYARLKSVSSNESFRVNFPRERNVYQVETSAGTVIAGPFALPRNVRWNTADEGEGVTMPGHYVLFTPTGALPSSGHGSAGRAKLLSTSGHRIDIVISPGGVIRQTAPYKSPPAPF